VVEAESFMFYVLRWYKARKYSVLDLLKLA